MIVEKSSGTRAGEKTDHGAREVVAVLIRGQGKTRLPAQPLLPVGHRLAPGL
jgi:hypothetical protein